KPKERPLSRSRNFCISIDETEPINNPNYLPVFRIDRAGAARPPGASGLRKPVDRVGQVEILFLQFGMPAVRYGQLEPGQYPGKRMGPGIPLSGKSYPWIDSRTRLGCGWLIIDADVGQS